MKVRRTNRPLIAGCLSPLPFHQGSGYAQIHLDASLFVFGATTGCAAVNPEQQRASDQAKCVGYGYQPGTDQFAHCMMTIDMRRQDHADAQTQNDADMKALSIRRNGDERFPVCSASMMDANLDTTNNAWYGPNCREK